MLAAQEGNAKEAVSDFEQSINLLPNYFTAHLNLGNCTGVCEQFDKAQDLSRARCPCGPMTPKSNTAWGCSSPSRTTSRAAAILERAIAMRPDYPDALNNLGVLHVRHEDSKAEEEFLSAIKIAPEYDQSYLNLARLYAMQNDRQKAREVLQQLLQLPTQQRQRKEAMAVLQSAP